VRAEFLEAVGRHEEAQAAQQQALMMTHNRAEQSLLQRRLGDAPC
jgi:predicted RNA polymerase sigma factor